MNTIAAIAAGGAIGAVLRHSVGVSAFKSFGDGFPFATLTVNVAGSFVMGVLIAVFAHIWQPPADIRAFVITGLLGAFTTFSTFSLDVSVLYERGDISGAVFYILLSVSGSVLALFAGLFLVRAAAL